MSGICGVWSFDGGDPDLAAVLAQLERRGPDGTHSWADGPVALGHTLLATTPEALVEVLPLTEPDSGCTITADARIDNRDELIAALDLCGEIRTIGDGELILRAYLKWGEDCPVQLLGDFAFAIWDPCVPRLFCARDHMGMRQLIYCHAPDRLFAFATEADALVAHPTVPKQINIGRIADFLDGLEGIDFTSTFFDNIVRLPPAHTLSIDSSGIALRCYWELQPGPELKLNTDQDYADAFLEVFTQAVRCRLRSARPVGSMLSGGLDSNSIAAVAAAELAAARRGPLQTFSAIALGAAECAESKSIRTAIRLPLFAPTVIGRDEVRHKSAVLELMVRQCAEPFDAYMIINHAVYRAARRSGLNVVLDGAGADVILTAGNRVAGLLRRGMIRAATREARLEAEFWGRTWPARKILLSALWSAYAPAGLRQLRWRLTSSVADWKMRLGRDSVSRRLARSVDLGERRSRFRRYLPRSRPTDTAYRAQSVRHPHLVVARERYDRVAAAFGIEPRDPFMDVRLIKFALSLPSGQLQGDGWPKAVLRRAMAGKIPEEIAWMRGKPHLGWLFTADLIAYCEALPAEQANIAGVMDMIASYQRSKISVGENKGTWLRLVILSSWLDRQGVDCAPFSCCGESNVNHE